MHTITNLRATRAAKLRLLACAAAVPLVLGAAGARAADTAAADAAAAASANAGADDSVGLSEVIVTAERQETDLQKTPISISVLNSVDLADRHVQSLVDLVTGGAPGLHVAPYASRPFNLILNIRGVGVMTDTNQPARESGVGVYIDGVYLGRPQGLNAALYDLQSIEVLKGPQGTLFGRNTEGGALNITTKKPTGEFHLDATAGAGDYGSYESEIHLDLPEYHHFSFKIDGIVTARDGTVENPLAGASDYGAFSRRGVRAQVQWQPAPNFTANYAYDTGHDESTTLYSNNVAAGSNKLAPIEPLQPERASTAVVGVPLQPSIGTQWGHSLTLKWDVAPWITLKSISAYRELTQTQWQDGPSAVFTPNAQFARYSLAEFVQNQYSQEFQALGEAGRFKYVAGALAYHEHVEDMAQTFNAMQFNADGTAATVIPLGSNITPTPIDIPILFPHAAIDRASRVTSESYGVYGQGTYTPPVFGDIVHLTAGLRWTYDKKDGQLYIINNAVPVDQHGVPGVLGFNKGWSRVDPMVTVAVDVTPDVEAYAKWGTGYRSGGANSRSLSYKPFNPEEVSMSEIGVKSEFWEHRARFDAAAYVGTIKDIQIDFSAPYYQFDANGNVITSASTTRTTTDTINAPGDSHVSGVETEFTLKPMEGLTLEGSYTYAYVHIPATTNPFPTYIPGTGTIVAATPIAIYQEYTPTHTVTAAINYSRPFEAFTLLAHLDGNWDSGSYGTDRDPSPVLPALRSQSGIVFNARISIADVELPTTGARMTVSLWSRNLFDEQHMFIRSISSTSGITGSFNEPRTFGVEAKIRM